MKITEEWIRMHATTKGGWTKAQLGAIGVSWPPPSGWLKRAIGQVISDDAQREFERRGYGFLSDAAE